MIRQPIQFSTKVAISGVAILFMLVAYEVMAARQTSINPKQTTVPSLFQFGEGLGEITKPNARGETWLGQDLMATFGRLAVGMGVGVLLSIFIGIAMGSYPWVEALFAPPILFLAKIPPTAMLAVYFVLFGTEGQMFVAMVGLSVFFTLAQSVYSAAKKDVTDHTVYKAYSLGASSPEVIYEVIWKQILPRVIEAIRLQIGPAMVFLIAAEYVVGDVGFGYRIRMQSRRLNYDVVYIYLIILGASGLTFDWLLNAIRRKLSPWFGE